MSLVLVRKIICTFKLWDQLYPFQVLGIGSASLSYGDSSISIGILPWS